MVIIKKTFITRELRDKSNQEGLREGLSRGGLGEKPIIRLHLQKRKNGRRLDDGHPGVIQLDVHERRIGPPLGESFLAVSKLRKIGPGVASQDDFIGTPHRLVFCC